MCASVSMFLSLPTHTHTWPPVPPAPSTYVCDEAHKGRWNCNWLHLHACAGKGDREKQIAAMENGVPAIAPIDLSDSFNDSGLLNTDTHRSVCVCAGKI